ncbi:MAG: hypothetical protein JJV90_01625, partial [Spiroplasma sp.]|nr:hypothetical protein [Mycoplasmatales bacterium]
TTPEFICKNFEKLLAMNLNVDINYIQINENLKININLKNIKIIKMKKPLGQSTWLKEKDEG